MWKQQHWRTSHFPSGLDFMSPLACDHNKNEAYWLLRDKYLINFTTIILIETLADCVRQQCVCLCTLYILMCAYHLHPSTPLIKYLLMSLSLCSLKSITTYLVSHPTFYCFKRQHHFSIGKWKISLQPRFIWITHLVYIWINHLFVE